MAETLKQITGKVDDAAAAIVMCGSGEKREVLYLNFQNTNSSSETLTFWYVPNDAGSVGVASTDGFAVVTYELAAGKNFIWDKPIKLESENDTIQAVSTTADMVHVTGVYVEVTP